MSNVTYPLTAHIPNEREAVHAEGLANPMWPLCLEAEARRWGYSSDEIAAGEVSDPDGFELNSGGFWVTTCTECLALVHA